MRKKYFKSGRKETHPLSPPSCLLGMALA
ncbi:CRISPR-associated protein Cas5 [Bacillus sp. 1P10SD]